VLKLIIPKLSYQNILNSESDSKLGTSNLGITNISSLKLMDKEFTPEDITTTIPT